MDSLSRDDYDDINNNRLAYLSFLNNLRNEKNKNYKDILQDDLQNKGDDGITSSTIKEEYNLNDEMYNELYENGGLAFHLKFMYPQTITNRWM